MHNKIINEKQNEKRVARVKSESLKLATQTASQMTIRREKDKGEAEIFDDNTIGAAGAGRRAVRKEFRSETFALLIKIH